MKKIKYENLIRIINEILLRKGCSEDLAMNISEILVEADAKGIYSHGVSRLPRYLKYIEKKTIDIEAVPEILLETPVSLVIDAKKAAGQFSGNFAMNRCIEKAEKSGICMATVKNSNHYGIAGHYSEMAIRKEMIGISMTNTAPLVVPTNGVIATLGTNPIAVAFPGDKYGFSLDMATSIASRGKIEVKYRKGERVPADWYINEFGEGIEEPREILKCLLENDGGGLLPLGGKVESSGGHKGYGLSALVELMTAGISLGEQSASTYKDGAGICHFFAAIKIDIFGNTERIINSVDNIIENVKKTETGEKIWFHGEKEARNYAASIEDGIYIDEKTYDCLKSIYPGMETDI